MTSATCKTLAHPEPDFASYSIRELPDYVRARVLDRYRDWNLHDEWWGACFDDFVVCAERLGIDIDYRRSPVGTSVKHDLAIYFTGFASQGDGACFEGRWRSTAYLSKEVTWSHCNLTRTVSVPFTTFLQAIRDHAPKDEALHDIARRLDWFRKRSTLMREWRAHVVRGRRSGTYVHERSVKIEAGCNVTTSDDYCDASAEHADEIASALRDFMRWMYWTLEAEHDHLRSDEAIVASLEANELRFDTEGEDVVR